MPDDLVSKTDDRYDDSNKPISQGFDLNNLSKCNHHWYRKSYTEIRCEKCTMGLTDVGNIEIENGQLKLKN